jgi:hypothetical protein
VPFVILHGFPQASLSSKSESRFGVFFNRKFDPDGIDDTLRLRFHSDNSLSDSAVIQVVLCAAPQ